MLFPVQKRKRREKGRKKSPLILFHKGMVVEETHLFRVTRDADVAIAEDEAGDLLETMEKVGGNCWTG